MTAKLIIALLILGHLLADFTLQTKEMAEQKQYKYSVLARHCGRGLIISIILTLPYLSLQLLGIELIIYCLHFLIDLGELVKNPWYFNAEMNLL